MNTVHIFHDFTLATVTENKLALMSADSWIKHGWQIRFINAICDDRLKEYRHLFPTERDYRLYHNFFRVPSLWTAKNLKDTLVFSHHDVINQGFKWSDVTHFGFTYYMELRCNAVMSCDFNEYIRYREFILERLKMKEVHTDGFFYDEPLVQKYKFGLVNTQGYHSCDHRRNTGKFVHYVGTSDESYFRMREEIQST